MNDDTHVSEFFPNGRVAAYANCAIIHNHYTQDNERYSRFFIYADITQNRRFSVHGGYNAPDKFSRKWVANE
jgi:hypothetical protein